MNRIFAILLDATWVACLYLGLVEGITGALNIGLFLTWAMFAISFALFSGDAVNKVGDLPVSSIARSMICGLVAMALLAWYSHFWAAAAVAWSTAIEIGAWTESRKVSAHDHR